MIELRLVHTYCVPGRFRVTCFNLPTPCPWDPLFLFYSYFGSFPFYTRGTEAQRGKETHPRPHSQ